jgi:hypothetical protein
MPLVPFISTWLGTGGASGERAMEWMPLGAEVGKLTKARLGATSRGQKCSVFIMELVLWSIILKKKKPNGWSFFFFW